MQYIAHFINHVSLWNEGVLRLCKTDRSSFVSNVYTHLNLQPILRLFARTSTAGGSAVDVFDGF